MNYNNLTKKRELDLDRLRRVKPIDDDFMRCIFKDNISLVQHVLRTITGIEDLSITSVVTQADMKRLVGARSLCLDALGADDEGRIYDIEIQQASRGADSHRARYHSSVLDVENLDANQDFTDLPITYTIFITQKDIFHKGIALYPIERVNLATNELFNDGEHILYVNGAYRGDDELGKLMHDFCCSDPDDMFNQDMADISRYFKETVEGVEFMCEIWEEVRQEGIEEGIEKEREHSIHLLVRTLIELGLDNNLIVNQIMKNYNCSEEEALVFLETAGN